MRLPDAEAPAPMHAVDVDVPSAVLHAVDETAGAVGRTRLVQILRGSRGRALRRGRPRRASARTASWPAMTDQEVLRAARPLIASGALEQTGGPYPLVRRPAGAQAATARDAALRVQIGARPARCRGGDPVPRPRAGGGRGRGAAPLAAEALGEIGGERAAAALRAAAPDDDPSVAAAVRLALTGP